jgi:predicted acylesterase/phospholipase RssA
MVAGTSPIPIQVVFQGGGAKLCVLMAVCEVLKKFAAEGIIEITRVAGSSAGAIAAAMLASKRPMDTYKVQVGALGTKYLSQLKTRQWAGAWRVYNGVAYFNNFNLEDFFEELFSREGGPKYVGDLRPDAQLYFTDLYSLEARVAPRDEPLPQALAKSCRIPFAFVGYGSGNTGVDGGLALNLPVDDLKREEPTKGSVIGISFSSGFGNTNKSGLLSYTQQLFSAAIQSGVARSEAILGKQNVFRIDTDIGTFDFKQALSEGLGVHYKLTSQQFETWLRIWLKSFGPIPVAQRDHVKRLIRPVLSNIPLAPAIIREIDDRHKAEPSTRALSVKSYETALLNDGGKFAGKYRTRTVMTFEVLRPINVIQFEFQMGPSGSFTRANLGCAAVDARGDSLRFTPDVQELTKPNDTLRTFRVYFLFDERLSPTIPSQSYVVEYQCESDDPYPDLGQKPETASLFRWQGDANEMTLGIAFPRSKWTSMPKVTDLAELPPSELERVRYQSDPDEELVRSEPLAASDLIPWMDLDLPADNYLLVGRRVGKIQQSQGFGFAIE